MSVARHVFSHDDFSRYPVGVITADKNFFLGEWMTDPHARDFELGIVPADLWTATYFDYKEEMENCRQKLAKRQKSTPDAEQWWKNDRYPKLWCDPDVHFQDARLEINRNADTLFVQTLTEEKETDFLVPETDQAEIGDPEKEELTEKKLREADAAKQAAAAKGEVVAVPEEKALEEEKAPEEENKKEEGGGLGREQAGYICISFKRRF